MIDNIQGALNYHEPAAIYGWVWSEDEPLVSQKLTIVVNGNVVANIVASIERLDLKVAGFGNGICGFHFSLSPYLIAGTNRVNAFISNSIPLLPKDLEIEIDSVSKFPKFNPFGCSGSLLRETAYGNMLLNTFDKGVDPALITYGEWGAEEVSLYEQLILPNDVVLDIGANIGASALPIAKLLTENGTVHCFEPQPFNFYRLCSHIILNQATKIIPNQLAISSEKEGEIRIPLINYAANHNSGSVNVRNEETVDSQIVKTVSVDSYCQNLDLIPNFIKIDVEGYEPNVFLGAKDTISNYKPTIYFECISHDDLKVIFSYLSDLNYKFYWHIAKIYCKNNFNQYEKDIYSGGGFSFNILAIQKDVDLIFDGFKPILSQDDFWPEAQFPATFQGKIKVMKKNNNQ